jgi:hypothetical protein
MSWPTGKPAHNRIEPPSLTTRICKTCTVEKHTTKDFYGNSHKCRQCTLAEKKANHDPVAARERNLFERYGLTLESFAEMLEGQDHKCLICHTTDPAKGGRKSGRGGGMKYFCVDHDHTTGKVRGLLCYSCNRIVGMIEESPEWCKRASAYIQKHNQH